MSPTKDEVMNTNATAFSVTCDDQFCHLCCKTMIPKNKKAPATKTDEPFERT